MAKKTWSTRLDEETERKVRNLIEKTGLKEAEVLRRLIIIGLKNVKEPADLIIRFWRFNFYLKLKFAFVSFLRSFSDPKS